MMHPVKRANWMSTAAKDIRGVEFQVGDRAVRGSASGRATAIEIVEIGKVQDGKIWVYGSHVPINFPGRLLIVNDLFPAVQHA